MSDEMQKDRATAVIVAAGQGLRMGTDTRKQYLAIAGVPVLALTLRVFSTCPAIGRMVVVVPGDDVAFCTRILTDFPGIDKPLDVIPGGEERQVSVYKGICAVHDPESIVVIHDGVRPFVTQDVIMDCIRAARSYKASVVGIPAQDTVKSVDGHGRIVKTLERSRIWLAQTPQAFECRLLKQAHEKALAEGFWGTDDAVLVERLGLSVKMIEGRKYNIKITTPEDLVLAEALMKLSLMREPE